MGSNNQPKETQGTVTPARQDVYNWAQGQRNTPSPIPADMYSRYQQAAGQNQADYGNLMQGYSDWRTNSLTPTVADINSARPATITPSTVAYNRDPATMGKAISGYTDFANTGGYSPTDIQELRARGQSPITAAYGNAMMQLDQQRSLQGGYSPNYTAAVASVNRNLPQQIADATTTVNANLADAIRQGKLAGLSGLTGIGGTEGGFNLDAAKANQGAGLTAQQANARNIMDWGNQKMAAQELLGSSLDKQSQLYGTTPGMASTFGNQVNQATGIENQRTGNMADTQLAALGQQKPAQPPLWQTLANLGTSFLPFL